MNEFKERSMKKERGMTPREVLSELNEKVEDIDDIVVFYQEKDRVTVEYSVDNPVMIIGIVEVGKHNMITGWQD